jgi:hypothetical protein
MSTPSTTTVSPFEAAGPWFPAEIMNAIPVMRSGASPTFHVQARVQYALADSSWETITSDATPAVSPPTLQWKRFEVRFPTNR